MHCYIGYKLSYEADAEKIFLQIEILVITYGLHYQELINLKVFSGVELHYRDLFHGKIYELLQKLTSGIK